jgi:hypothetical protein
MEAGMNGGPAFGGWQHCRGGILHMLAVNGGFCRLEALRSFRIFYDFLV